MEDSFLSLLTDTTQEHFVFGKNEKPVQSVFLHLGDGKPAADAAVYIRLYQGHELKAVNSKPIQRNNVSPDWLFPIVLLLLAFFAWLRLFYSKFFVQMLRAFLNLNLSNQIVRDENIFFQRVSIYLSIVFNVILALLVYFISIHYNWHVGGVGPGFMRYLFFVVVITAAYALKYLVLKITGWLFEQEREIATYIFNIFLINNILGMALLPFVCLLAYNQSISGPWLIYVPLILIGVGFAWRYYRGFRIGMGTGSFSPLYLFLYLCTLEIAPLMILIRIIVQ
jgi:hypothetical protein